MSVFWSYCDWSSCRLALGNSFLIRRFEFFLGFEVFSMKHFPAPVQQN